MNILANLPTHNIALILFLAVFALFAFYSGMTVYSLLKFGKSRILGTAVSVVFVLLILGLAINAFINISSI